MEIQKREKELMNIKKRMQREDAAPNFTGKAFVIFNNQSDSEKLVWMFKRTWIRKLINFILLKIFRCKKAYTDERWWEGRWIDVERAAEPTNIFWENMAVKQKTRVWKASVTYFIAFLCL